MSFPVRDCGEDTCSLKPGLCMEHDYYGFFDEPDFDEDFPGEER